MSDDFDELARRLRRLCLSATPGSDDISALGGSPRWSLYRELVRGRIRGAIFEALPRTRDCAGHARFEAWITRWLDASPPRTRYVRALMPEFVRWLGESRGERGALPEFFDELLRYEVACHAVALAPDPSSEELAAGEFVMHRPAKFHPVLRRLDLRWEVHLDPVCPAASPSPRALLIVRDPTRFSPETLALTPMAAAVFDAMREGRDDVTTCVQRCLASQELAAGEAFMESFAELLATLIERGVLLGSAP